MIKTESSNGIIVAKFDKINRLSALITEPVKEKLNSLFQNENTKLILDLEGIDFIDSSGFGVFLSVMKNANNSKGQFKICNISKEVMELFKLLQLHNVFELYNNLEDCKRSFNE